MGNRRGKSWDFPDYTSREELEKLYKAKVRMLEVRIEQLETELLEYQQAEAIRAFDEEIMEEGE